MFNFNFCNITQLALVLLSIYKTLYCTVTAVDLFCYGQNHANVKGLHAKYRLVPLSFLASHNKVSSGILKISNDLFFSLMSLC